jgi:hypothetical protein
MESLKIIDLIEKLKMGVEGLRHVIKENRSTPVHQEKFLCVQSGTPF